jgi:hypothetical protein
MTESENPILERLVGTFLKLKEKRDVLKEEFEAKDKPMAEAQDKIKAALMKHCKDTGAERGGTQSGHFFRVLRKKYWTNDWEKFGEFIVENNIPELLEKRINQGNVEQFITENPDVPVPGLNVESAYSITVQKRRGGIGGKSRG